MSALAVELLRAELRQAILELNESDAPPYAQAVLEHRIAVVRGRLAALVSDAPHAAKVASRPLGEQ